MDAGVERRGETTDADVVGQAVEPVAQTVAVGVGVQFEIVVLRCDVLCTCPAAFARHPVDVCRPADDHEVGRGELLRRRVVNGDDRCLEDRLDPFGDVLGDRMGVAEHRLVHDQCAHHDLLWPGAPGSDSIMSLLGGVRTGRWSLSFDPPQPARDERNRRMRVVRSSVGGVGRRYCGRCSPRRISSTPGSIMSLRRRPTSGRSSWWSPGRRRASGLVLESAELRPGVGLVGDNYLERGSSKPGGGPADPLGELNLMSARALEAVAGATAEPVAARRRPADRRLRPVRGELSGRNAPRGRRARSSR